MQQLDTIPIFLAVAEAGGFRRAADRLGMTSAGVSKAVARLEAELDTRLFERTTRRVDLTPQGVAFRAKAEAAMLALDEGARALDIAREAPSGLVRLSLSPVLGAFLAARLPELAERLPGLAFDLDFSDTAVDLSAEGYDIALRVGLGAAAHLVTRRIARLDGATLATPGYLARHGTPEHPDNLADHVCYGYLMKNGQVAPWDYLDGTVALWHLPEGPMRLNLGAPLVDAALSGRGIVRIFGHLAADAIDAGRLVRVLGRYEPPGPEVQALILPSVASSARVRAVLDFLYRTFRSFPAR